VGRSKEEVIENILEICKEPSSKTKIVYQANLNFKNATRYLDQLINTGHLEASGTTPITYKTTQKGMEFLEHIKSFNALLRPADKLSLTLHTKR
jgi:predicted transcriptional regulator